MRPAIAALLVMLLALGILLGGLALTNHLIVRALL